MRLERLAVYHDPGSTPWELEKAWEDMTPGEWEEVYSELVIHHLMHMVIVCHLSLQHYIILSHTG